MSVIHSRTMAAVSCPAMAALQRARAAAISLCAVLLVMREPGIWEPAGYALPTATQMNSATVRPGLNVFGIRQVTAAVQLLSYGPVERRVFATWSMHAVNWDESCPASRRAFLLGQFGQTAFKPSEMSARRALNFLEVVAAIQLRREAKAARSDRYSYSSGLKYSLQREHAGTFHST